MTVANFFILDVKEDKLHFACELIENLYKQKHKIFIQCTHQQAAEAFDDLLWGFKMDSFIPHNLQGEGPTPPPPVQIGFSDSAKGFYDTFINLSDEVLPFAGQFKEVIEIVDNDEANKKRLRQHYRHYQAKGFQLKNTSSNAISAQPEIESV